MSAIAKKTNYFLSSLPNGDENFFLTGIIPTSEKRPSSHFSLSMRMLCNGETHFLPLTVILLAVKSVTTVP